MANYFKQVEAMFKVAKELKPCSQKFKSNTKSKKSCRPSNNYCRKII